ncbi:penicillin acylase family protein [Oceanibium sediminis]|uniref:penicillin acylase family protein n=1 Tax=Oceanibium sediminis TaxID=2026339 RepID=UPI000DD35187|nr:penicillin acylase family protein [Oceanibium sediminis]
MTRKVFNWLLRALGVMVFLSIAGAGLAYYLASHSVPEYDARHRLDSAPGEVEIVRDNYAVPHIFAESDAAVFFGLGFAHAQDRLWQMTMTRRVAQGRLSELFGERTLSTDHLMRALDLYGIAGRTHERQNDQVKAELQAYADGVNAYLKLVQTEALGRGAPEFFLFPPNIAPWTPTDSVAVLKVFALQLTDKASAETLRAELSLRIGPERLADILPEAPAAVLALPEYAGSLGLSTQDLAALPTRGARTPLSPVPSPGTAGASNAFAAAPGRAAAGAALHASDPHLGLSVPSPLYLAHLELQSGGAIGATVPGVPAILIGRTATLAWGVTASYLDDQDIVIERLGEADGTYVSPEGDVPFEERDTVIPVKDAQPRSVKLRWTRNGPVIPAPHFGAAAVTPPGHVAALSWTALTAEDRTIEAAMNLMRRKDIASVQPLLDLFHAPAMNLVMADAGGHIAIQAIGAAPDRLTSHVSQGRIPAAGWLARNLWQGTRPAAENPGVGDPEGGIVVNTNNRTTDAPFPAHWSFEWGDAHRILRASRMLNGRAFHTLDSFVEVQTDTISPAARALLPLIGRNLWYQGEPAAQDTVERQRQIALEALASWTGEMDEHAFEPLIFAAWTRQLQRRLILDDLGDLARSFARPDPQFLERVFRDVDGASAWCDIRQSTQVEDCETLARQALDAAILELSETYGPRIDGWRWGAAHVASHDHPVLGGQTGLDWLLNIVQETPGGDFTMLRGQTAGTDAAPYANVHASVYRQVVDFADPDGSVFILSTGQSGHPLSRHYDDLALLWRRSEYIPMSLDPTLARGGAVGITRLLPRSAQSASAD